MKNKPIAFIRELLKGKTEKEILREYILVVKEIVDRLERENNPEIKEDFDKYF